MLKHYVEAVKRLRTDKDGVVSFEYVIVAACVVAVVVAAFGTGASTAIGSADRRVHRDRHRYDWPLISDSRAGHWDVPMPRLF